MRALERTTQTKTCEGFREREGLGTPERRMRVLLAALLIAFVAQWAARAGEGFTLTVAFIPDQREPNGIAIELRNASAHRENLALLTNLFQGLISMRTPEGQVLEFTQSNYIVLRISALLAIPDVQHLPPS